MSINISEKYKKFALNGFLFGSFLLKNLPMGWLAGLRVSEFTEEHVKVVIRYKWLTQNPFKSVYFACLAMAAELSTGVIAVGAVNGITPSVAMLVVGLKADFTKKAIGKITFVCSDVTKICENVEKCCKSKESVTVVSESVGYDETGDKVASFWITWSFKQRGK